MAALTPRQKLKALAPNIRKFLRSRGVTAKPSVPNNKSAQFDEYARMLVRASDKAFKRFGFSRNNPGHRLLLLHCLAWAIYGGKGPGHPKKWTTKAQDILLDDIRRLSREKPELKEGALCSELCIGKSKLDRYARVKPATLRRRLQDAKKRRRRDVEEEASIRALRELI